MLYKSSTCPGSPMGARIHRRPRRNYPWLGQCHSLQTDSSAHSLLSTVLGYNSIDTDWPREGLGLAITTLRMVLIVTKQFHSMLKESSILSWFALVKIFLARCFQISWKNVKNVTLPEGYLHEEQLCIYQRHKRQEKLQIILPLLTAGYLRSRPNNKKRHNQERVD